MLRAQNRVDQADNVVVHHVLKFCLLCTSAFQVSKKFPLIRLQPPSARCWSELHLHEEPLVASAGAGWHKATAAVKSPQLTPSEDLARCLHQVL